MIARRHPRGAAILSLVLSLAIMGILAGMYFEPVQTPTGGTQPWAIYQIERTRDTVCMANRRTAETTLLMHQMDHNTRQLGTESMQQLASRFPPCPGEGAFYFGGDHILCTAHNPLPRFRDALNIPLPDPPTSGA